MKGFSVDGLLHLLKPSVLLHHRRCRLCLCLLAISKFVVKGISCFLHRLRQEVVTVQLARRSNSSFFYFVTWPIMVKNRQRRRRRQWADTTTLSFLFLFLLNHWFSQSCLLISYFVFVFESCKWDWDYRIRVDPRFYTYPVVKTNNDGSVKVSLCQKKRGDEDDLYMVMKNNDAVNDPNFFWVKWTTQSW